MGEASVNPPYASITFLTYEDLSDGERFYGETLGLDLIEDQGWAKVYRISDTANVGLVSARRRPAPEIPGAGVLLSIVVDDVDAWYEKLRTCSQIEIDNPPAMVEKLPVYSFFLTDPGGYRVEIQAFTDLESARRFGSRSA